MDSSTLAVHQCRGDRTLYRFGRMKVGCTKGLGWSQGQGLGLRKVRCNARPWSRRTHLFLSGIYENEIGSGNGRRDRVTVGGLAYSAHSSNRHSNHNRRQFNGSNVKEGANRSRDDAVQRTMKSFHEGPDGPPLRILPIGGLGEIGMNCMLVGNYDRYIMIDAGLMFPDFDELGVQKVLPDTAFIRRWRDKIEAVIITHGHEDHIGALPWVIPALDPKTPIYATGFTMQLIKSRLKEYNIPSADRCRTFEMRQRFQAGPFEIEPVRVTHSIPDCCGLVLRCQDGTIFHTGDWKIDESPVDGNTFDRTTLEQLSKEGVTLLMSDSTNVLAPGRTTSEADVAKALIRRIASAKGRVISTQFASNVHRLGSVKAAAEATGRKLVFIGISLRTYLEAAWRDGQAPFDPSTLLKAEDMGGYSPRDLLIVTTGSQAEPRAALNLASFGTSHLLKLNKYDLVLYSAKMIPGNETRVVRMMNRIAELGPTIVQGRGDNLHTSGHGYRDELEEVLRLVKPQHFLPVHGEFAFLKEHELLGKANGIRHTAVIKNGEMLGVSPLRNGKVLSTGFSHLGKEEFKLMYNDGDRAFGTATDLCLHERMQIALEGMIVASVEIVRVPVDIKRKVVSKKEGEGEEVGLKSRIRITTRCMWTDGGRLVEHLRKVAEKELFSIWRDISLPQIERKIANALRKATQKYINRRPEVIVIATEAASSAAPNKEHFEDSTVKVQSFPSSSHKQGAAKSLREVADQAHNSSYEPPKTGAEHVSEEKFAVEQSRPVIQPSDPLLDEPLPSVQELVSDKPSASVEEPVLDQPVSSLEDPVIEEPPLAKPAPQDLSARSAPDLVDVSQATDGPKRARKWKMNETLHLINVRSNMEANFKSRQAKKALWKKIAQSLAENGFERTPEQCSSMWSTLVKKHKNISDEIRSGVVSAKGWVYFNSMERAIALQIAQESVGEPAAN